MGTYEEQILNSLLLGKSNQKQNNAVWKESKQKYTFVSVRNFYSAFPVRIMHCISVQKIKPSLRIKT